MNEQRNRDRLAAEVKTARRRKFRTVDAARIAAGVARGTWDSVEKGEPVKEFSLAAIEEALDWPAGKAFAILAGDDDPKLLDEIDQLREAVRAARAAGATRAELQDVLDAEAG